MCFEIEEDDPEAAVALAVADGGRQTSFQPKILINREWGSPPRVYTPWYAWEQCRNQLSC